MKIKTDLYEKRRSPIYLQMRESWHALLMLVILLQSFGIGVSRAQSSDEPRLIVEFSETPFIDVINYIKRHTKFDFLL